MSTLSMNFAREINPFKNFSLRNLFIRKRNDKNFSQDLFGVEINANENKANYDNSKDTYVFLRCDLFPPDSRGHDV